MCENKLRTPIEQMDKAVLGAIAGDVLRPEVVDAVLQRVIAALERGNQPTDGRTTETAIRETDRKIQNLTRAIENGGQDLDSLLAALRAAEKTGSELRERLTSYRNLRTVQVDRGTIAEEVASRLEDWQQLLTRRPQQGRQLLREALQGPITLRLTSLAGMNLLEPPHSEVSSRARRRVQLCW